MLGTVVLSITLDTCLLNFENPSSLEADVSTVDLPLNTSADKTLYRLVGVTQCAAARRVR